MIYLENNTSKQLIYIPKNEDGCITHKAPSDCGECFDEGVAYAKSLMEDGEFFQNGDYQNDNGWSAITVNVPDSANLESKTVIIEQDTTIVIPSSGYDGMSSVFVDASDYGQGKYEEGVDDGFDDGYSSGYTQGSDYEKAKLGATGFTFNGDYTKSEGGWSSVTVNVEQSGHTDEELVEAYNSGYTSGETHQKLLLTTTAFTENGQYTLANGWSAVTVDIEGLNIEPNKSFTATSNGEYTITPSSGLTSVTSRFDSDNDEFYCTIDVDIDSYPSVGYFELVRIEDEFDSSKGYIEIYIDDGVLDYNNNWNPEEDADIDRYNDSIKVTINNANRYIDWSPLADYGFKYDTMSAVTVNVNVPSGMDITLSAITITENTAITASAGTAFSSITVDVPEPQCPEFNDGELEITTNGTYLADDYGYDGFSAVTVDVPSDYGELYCLYCEDAVWGSYVSTPYTSGATLVIMMANVLDSSGITYTITGKTQNGAKPTLTAKFEMSGTSISYMLGSNGYGLNTNTFPNATQYIIGYDTYYSPHTYYASNAKVQTNNPMRSSFYGTFSGSTYYLYRLNGTALCAFVPAVDENGYGALRNERGTRLYKPVSGYAWPVYRKKVNGVWKYRIVKQIVL